MLRVESSIQEAPSSSSLNTIPEHSPPSPTPTMSPSPRRPGPPPPGRPLLANTIAQIAAGVFHQWTAEKREQLRDDYQSHFPGKDFGDACRHYVHYMIAKATAEAETNPFSPPFVVDEIWHCHLLDTAAYRSFCAIVLAACASDKEYLDHSTKTIGDGLRPARLGNLRRTYQAMDLACAAWPDELQNLAGGGGSSGGASNSAAAALSGSRQKSPRRVDNSFVLFVKTFSAGKTLIFGKTLTFENLTPTTNMQTVVEEIQDREGFPPDEQRLIFAGKPIWRGCRSGSGATVEEERRFQQECQKTLADWEVESESTIYLVLRGSSSAAPALSGSREAQSLRRIVDNGFLLFVKTPNGETLTLDKMTPATNMQTVVEEIYERTGIPPYQQYIVWASHGIWTGQYRRTRKYGPRDLTEEEERQSQQQEQKTLADLNMHRESLMHVVVRPDELQNLADGGGNSGGASSSAATTLPGSRRASPPRVDNGFVLFVIKRVTGKYFTVDNLTPTTTVQTLAEEIQEHAGIPPDEQRLLFAGKQIWLGCRCSSDSTAEEECRSPQQCQKTLADWNVVNESSIYLVRDSSSAGSLRRVDNGFVLFVKTPNGETSTFDYLTPTTNMQTVVEEIAERTGIPPYQQRLVFAGKEMWTGGCSDYAGRCGSRGLTEEEGRRSQQQDQKTLADWNVASEDTIHVIIRFAGC